MNAPATWRQRLATINKHRALLVLLVPVMAFFITFRFIPSGRAPMSLGASGPGLIAVRREIEPL